MKENLRLKANVKVANPVDTSRYEELELIIDTGATFSVIKKERLQRLGIQATRCRKFRTADGEIIERAVGAAWFEIIDKKEAIISDVVFGEANDTELLGLHTLEGMALTVDTKTGELKPIELFLL